MSDREKVIGHLYDCLAASKPENLWVFVRKDIVGDALELLREQPKQKFFVDSDGKITPLPIQKHGHWISVPDKSPKTTTINMYSFICSCSECGQSVGHHIEYNYCPRCGAKMDEGVKQDG